MAKNSFVFNSYTYNVLLGNKPSLYHPGNFDLWFCPRTNMSNDNDSLLDINFTFGDFLALQKSKVTKKKETVDTTNKGSKFDITKIPAVYLGNLGSIVRENVSKEDGLPSSGVYQDADWLNIPASAYIFSKYNYPPKCKVNKDDNYDAGDYNYWVNDTFNTRPAGQTAVELNRFNDFTQPNIMPSAECSYFEREYHFTSGYDANEYNIYSIDVNHLVESQFNFKPADNSFTINPTDFVGGGLIITWYDGNSEEGYEGRTKLYEHDGKIYYPGVKYEPGSSEYNEYEEFAEPKFNLFPIDYWAAYPCCYVDLPKDYNLKDTCINVKWSENGVFSLT